MARALSRDLRDRIVRAYVNGEGSQQALAERFVVSQSGISRLLKHHQVTGSLNSGTSTGRPSKVTDQALLTQLLEARPEATLSELAVLYGAATNQVVSHVAIYRALERFGLTRKKKSVRFSR